MADNNLVEGELAWGVAREEDQLLEPYSYFLEDKESFQEQGNDKNSSTGGGLRAKWVDIMG